MKKKIGLLLLLAGIVVFVMYEKLSKTDADVMQPSNSESETSTEKDERVEQAVQDKKPTIIVSNAKAKPGEKVKITAEIVNNPGILGMSMTLSYDEKIMKLISVENGKAFESVLNMSNSNSLESGCVFLWDGEAITTDQVLDGDILVMEFQIDESAPVGTTPILLTSDEDGTVDKDLQTLNPVIDNGTITISQ